MDMKTKRTSIVAGAALAAGILWALTPARDPNRVVLTLGAFTAPREAYHEIIPLFQKYWKEKTGKIVEVRASYLGSGAQSRAIAGGFEADVAALSLDSDLARLEKAGLITHPWRKTAHKGVVTTSVVAIAVREGNPKGIRDWADLARPGVEVLTPNPKTSGGAQWNFLALYGAAERGAAEPYAAGDAGAFRFAVAVFKNVSVMDKGARESLINFERGLGDAAITYENEILAARLAGVMDERVIPRSTVLIQNPAAVVDAYAEKHGVRAEAEGFLDFLWTPAAQEVFARNGFRPVDLGVMARHRDSFPKILDLWTIDDLGGWSDAGPVFFGPGGVYDGVLEEAHAAVRS